MSPRLLDLFGGEGCGAAGYARAGWLVDGVEHEPARARRYPYAVHVGDAIEYVKQHAHQYDAVHASPPCQWYSRGNAPRRGTVTRWHRSIPPVREALEATGLPYVIENVGDAAWDLAEPVTLCGCMFGLSTLDDDGTRLHLRRPRLFEAHGFTLAAPRPCLHHRAQQIAGAYGGARRDKDEARHVRRGGYVPPNKDVVKRLLGVEHDVTWAGLYEALPPAYTEHVGRALLAAVRGGL